MCRPRSHLRQKGTATIETALVLLPMMAILLVSVDLCMILFLRTTFQNAVREGARYAVTSRLQQGMGHDASIRYQVQKSSIGFLNGAENASRVSIRYFDPVTLSETSSNAAGNVVEVSIENFPYNPIAPFWHYKSPVFITVRSSDRMEGQPNGPPAR